MAGSLLRSYFALQARKQELLEKRIEMAESLEARQKLSLTEKELYEGLFEEEQIIEEHAKNNQDICSLLGKNNILPENLLLKRILKN